MYFIGQCGIAVMLYKVGKTLQGNPSLEASLSPLKSTLCFEKAHEIVSKNVDRFQRLETFVEGMAGALALQVSNRLYSRDVVRQS